MSGFTNQGIKAPVQGKPHICLREGWWRVSPWDRHGIGGWHKAHLYVAYLNFLRHPTK